MTALKEQLRRIQSGKTVEWCVLSDASHCVICIAPEDDPELQKNFKELREVRDKRIHMAETFREYEASLVSAFGLFSTSSSCLLSS